MEIPTEEYLVPIGKAKVLEEGRHVTLVSYSRMINLCKEAAQQLRKEGISVELIDLRTIRPLDTETIVNSVRKTNRLVSVEEGWPFAGIGSELALCST